MKVRSLCIMLICSIVMLVVCVLSTDSSFAGTNIGESLMPGIPLGGTGDDPDYDLCPQGVRSIEMFLSAWKDRDYAAMYQMLDPKSKEKYSEKDTIFNFRFLEYKPYKISSIRTSGNNYEFILSFGSWDTADKDVIKMLIDGTTFRVIMPTSNSPFKKSAESYY